MSSMQADEGVRVDRGHVVLAADRWRSAGPTMVLLHAGVCDRRSWRDVVPWLRRAGSVMAYDRRGFGQTPPSTSPFSHLEDLLAVLDATAGGEPVWLVGSSMGGGLAVDAALAAPERVAGLVLLAPSVSGAPGPERLDPATQQLSDALDAAVRAADTTQVNQLEIRVWLDGPAGPDERVSGPARELALAMNAIVLSNAAPEEPDVGHGDAWARLSDIAVPATVACGDLDVPSVRRQAVQVAARIPGARWVDLPGTAHLPYLEQPRLIADLVTSAVQGA